VFENRDRLADDEIVVLEDGNLTEGVKAPELGRPVGMAVPVDLDLLVRDSLLPQEDPHATRDDREGMPVEPACRRPPQPRKAQLAFKQSLKGRPATWSAGSG